MKSLGLLFAAAPLALLPLAAQDARDPELTPDQVAVRAALEDYVLGFYEAAPERLERALAPDLVKKGYWRPEGEQEYRDASLMTYEQALDLASTWNAEGQQGTDLPYEIELFEVCDKTACGKLTAMWGQDTFQLAKEDGQWRIHHILWQSAPTRVDR